MTYDPQTHVYIDDIDAADLGLRPGQWPLVVTHEDRRWILDTPKLSPSYEVEAYDYVSQDDADYPLVLRVWND